MFYELQPKESQQEYKEMLALVGSLSNLFSESEEPLLNYRAHENIFCKYFNAINLSREDCSADAAKGTMGIGLKTWVGRNDQKIAEFGRLRPSYEHLTGLELVQTIAEYRNTRIRTTMKLHGLEQMIYHIVKRVPNAMKIYECAFHFIDIDNIVVDEHRGNENNTYFTDGLCTYHFSMSKNTLYMIFDDMVMLDEFDVEIETDPYNLLKKLIPTKTTGEAINLDALQHVLDNVKDSNVIETKPQLCLRLYAIDSNGTKYVPEKSGLNQWNAGGRERNADELYIAYLAPDRAKNESFFPPRNQPFKLTLPDGTEMQAKVCQRAYKKVSATDYEQLTAEEKAVEDQKSLVGKSIMSKPNKKLGKWLLRDVFELPEGTLVTYDMLKKFGIDSVIFTKNGDKDYSIDFCPLGTYERMNQIEDHEAEYDTDE